MTEGSEEEVLQQLALSEQRLVALTEELASRDLESLRREMEDEEVSFEAPLTVILISTKFRHTVEHGLSGNAKVEVPKTGEEASFYGEGVG